MEAAMSDETKRRAISELCFGEQILVWGTRAWLTGPGGRARVCCELTRAMGEAEGRATAAALGGMLAVFNSAALRTLYIGPMSCRMVWPDEERILAAIRYLHAGSRFAAERVLEKVLPPAAQRLALERAEVLARRLAEAGYRLGFGGPVASDIEVAAPAVPTLH
jgi:hypothetical protein